MLGRVPRLRPAVDLGRRLRDWLAATADGAAPTATSPTSPTSAARSSTGGRSTGTPPRSTGSGTPTACTVARRRHGRRQRGLLRPADRRRGTDPTHEVFTTEYFGPILGVYVYDDADYDERGAAGRDGRAVRADRRDLRHGPAGRSSGRQQALRFAAGNFYVNDKPTGAVVGQQPFGGARASRHQRQGRLLAQPAALDVAAGDQGDVRAADRPPLPAHGLNADGCDRDDLVQGEGPVVAAQPAPRVDVAARQVRVVDDPFGGAAAGVDVADPIPVSRPRPRSRAARPVPVAVAGRAAG